ncbi:MAG: 16S rRNA (cytidine(1402)-2'-O)-methyltransferase [Elusimicrobiota bacterium]
MLYLVATPIGNLEDLTPRARRILSEVRAVYCEDTRRTKRLFSHFDIHTPLLRYKDRDPRGVEHILERLRRGENLALASDAGTPVVSDPGLDLVAQARREGLEVLPLPGACSVPAAVAASGLPGDSFVFLGFLPRSPGKLRKTLAQAATLERTIVVFESPYRVVKLLRLAEEVLGARAQAAICRELSKLHEEWWSGTLDSVRGALEARGKLLGEFVVLFHPRRI